MTALLNTPHILYAALGCHRALERANSVRHTWAQHLLPTDRLVWLGDEKLASLMPDAEVWPCVLADGPDDSYGALPIKMRTALHRALRDPSWDFLVKVDDDTHVIPARLSAILAEYSPTEPLFAGGQLWLMTSEHYLDHEQRGFPPFDFPFLQGGTGYCLTRPALERAMPFIDEELGVAGMEDVLLSIAFKRAGIPASCLGPFSHTEREWESMLFGAAYAIHRMRDPDHQLIEYMQEELPVLPFIVASASLGWGRIGLHGALGFERKRVKVGGIERKNALSAHAPSEVLLRATPGMLMGWRGALNASAGEHASATFRILDSKHRQLAHLGSALFAQPTYRETVKVPPDGRLWLEITTESPPLCHSVWLWDVDPFSEPAVYPFARR